MRRSLLTNYPTDGVDRRLAISKDSDKSRMFRYSMPIYTLELEKKWQLCFTDIAQRDIAQILRFSSNISYI